MTYLPQLMAVGAALSGALAINAIVAGISRTFKEQPHVQRSLPMLPVLFGALFALWQWPYIFTLACTGMGELGKIDWSRADLRGFCIMAGIGQGAVSLNMHKFFTQTLMGKDGIVQAALRKKLELPPAEAGDSSDDA